MSARLFHHIKKVLATSNNLTKTVLFAIAVIGMFLGNFTPALADNKFDDYKYLFGRPDSGTPGVNQAGYGGNVSTFSYAAPLLNKEKKTMDGLWFKFSFTFQEAEKSWKHLPYDGSEQDDAFIVRNCDANPAHLDANGNIQDKYCFYSRVLYVYDVTVPFWDKLKNFFAGVIRIANPTEQVLPAVLKAQYNLKLFKEDSKTFIIYRKDKDDDWVRSQSVDLLQGLSSDDKYKWLTLQQNATKTWDVHHAFGETRSVSLWYCGIQYDNLDPKEAYSWDPNDSNDIKQFGTLCNGSSYFRISPEIRVTLPKTFEEAQAIVANTTPEQPNKVADKGTLPGCDLFNGTWVTGSGSFMGCIAQLVYYAIYSPLQWFAGIMGSLFDFFIGFALDDASYRADFVVTAWKVVRDISNIFFILILVWTGLAAVFDVGKHSMKKVIPQLIINALLINFSLFAVRLVVDISNVVANVFYNRINTTMTKDGQTVSVNRSGPGGYKPLSEKLISGFNPQKIFSARNAAIQQYNARIIEQATSTDVNSVTKDGDVSLVNVNSTRYANYYILISLLAAAIMLAIAIMFWKTAFFFLGRVIGIYITMIFSPFALLTLGDMPLIGGIDKLKWDDWKGELVKYSLLAPIFVFFLFVIYLLVNSPFLYSSLTELSNPDAGFFSVLLSVSIPMLIIYYMIDQGVKLANKYAGEVGSKVQGYAMKGAQFAAGAALGGVGFLGRRTIGNVAANFAESDKFRNWAARSKVGKLALRGTNKVASSSFDARGVSIFGKNLKDAEITSGKAQVGGFAKERQEKVKREQEFASRLLDTSDYGKAKVARKRRKVHLAAGMNLTDASLAAKKDAATHAEVRDVRVRNTYANRIQDTSKTYQIAGDKIRREMKKKKPKTEAAKDIRDLLNEMLGEQPPAPGGGAPGGPTT